MTSALDDLLQQKPFSLPQAEKEKRLLPLLRELTEHHRAACPSYKRITDLTAPHAEQSSTLEEIPFLPVSLFKYRRLRSIASENVRTTVQSSGTTGAQKSQIDLDAEGSKNASRALNTIIGSLTGNRRLPMLIIDNEAALAGKSDIGARASAILGLMPYGRDPCFALNDDFSFAADRVAAFLNRHAGNNLLLFGFTFIVWQHFLPACEALGLDFSCATLLHSGGWKKLQDQSVDNKSFKDRLTRAGHFKRIVNFYGMAELPGTIFLENEDGLLYPPHFADVIIRDPVTLEPVPQGVSGLVEILSPLPRSYPGHALLTEDIGVIEAIDSGIEGYYGKALRLIGRAPRAELRGCSDVLAERFAS